MTSIALEAKLDRLTVLCGRLVLEADNEQDEYIQRGQQRCFEYYASYVRYANKDAKRSRKAWMAELPNNLRRNIAEATDQRDNPNKYGLNQLGAFKAQGSIHASVAILALLRQPVVAEVAA